MSDLPAFRNQVFQTAVFFEDNTHFQQDLLPGGQQFIGTQVTVFFVKPGAVNVFSKRRLEIKELITVLSSGALTTELVLQSEKTTPPTTPDSK